LSDEAGAFFFRETVLSLQRSLNNSIIDLQTSQEEVK